MEVQTNPSTVFNMYTTESPNTNQALNRINF